MTNTTWVLVANASHARLFQTETRGKDWTLLRELEHPESRAAVHELVDDDRGRMQQSGGHVYGAAMEPRTDPKEIEMKRFARELARLLEVGVDDHVCAKIVLAAPPHFLGLLRGELQDKVTRRVDSTHDKDYHGLNARELADRLSVV